MDQGRWKSTDDPDYKRMYALVRKTIKASPYKDIAGSYRCSGWTLFIDHVQGDPFAAPSRLRVRLEPDQARLPEASFRERLEARRAVRPQSTLAIASGVQHPRLARDAARRAAPPASTASGAR